MRKITLILALIASPASAQFAGLTTRIGTVETAIRVSTGVAIATGSLQIDNLTRSVLVRRTSIVSTVVTLPSNPAAGREIMVKDDVGDAASNPITISGGSATIDGAATLVIDWPNGSVKLVYGDGNWRVEAIS